MPSKNSKEFVHASLVTSMQTMLAFMESIASESDMEPSAKRQKLDAPAVVDKYAASARLSRTLQKLHKLAVGLKESSKAVLAAADSQPKRLMVFLVHDKEHQQESAQLLAACKQAQVNHYVLPKFAKAELCKVFGVKRVTSFALVFDGMPERLQLHLEKELEPFNQLVADGKADINKFRYADDSMFVVRAQNELRSTQIKKWTVEIHGKNHKKLEKLRAKSANG